jgi:hypothetical protein
MTALLWIEHVRVLGCTVQSTIMKSSNSSISTNKKPLSWLPCSFFMHECCVPSRINHKGYLYTRQSKNGFIYTNSSTSKSHKSTTITTRPIVIKITSLLFRRFGNIILATTRKRENQKTTQIELSFRIVQADEKSLFLRRLLSRTFSSFDSVTS